MTPKPSAFTSFPLEPLDPIGAPIVRAVPGARGVAPAVLVEAFADGDVRCHACAHRCLVRPGRRAICGVRENRDGRLVTLVYGEVAAAIAEPIEKKPLYHAWPGTVAYSIGTQGCNFHCRFCQNWEIAQAPREGLLPRARRLPPEDAVADALAAGARAIAYTYTEPTVFLEYVLDTARLARAAGLGNVLVTNGFETPESLELLAPVIDAANVDLKAFDDAVYRRVCGGRLAPVLDALKVMRRLGIWVEVTTLLIPGSDDPGRLAELARWIAAELGPETPWHVSRFWPAFRWLDRPPTP
ncbi:MAG TPA: AmmeMemoRadiSam system radical SAM enzyme, partial [Candidatus Limnocylindrales bacterium]